MRKGREIARERRTEQNEAEARARAMLADRLRVIKEIRDSMFPEGLPRGPLSEAQAGNIVAKVMRSVVPLREHFDIEKE